MKTKFCIIHSNLNPRCVTLGKLGNTFEFWFPISKNGDVYIILGWFVLFSFWSHLYNSFLFVLFLSHAQSCSRHTSGPLLRGYSWKYSGDNLRSRGSNLFVFSHVQYKNPTMYPLNYVSSPGKDCWNCKQDRQLLMPIRQVYSLN